MAKYDVGQRWAYQTREQDFGSTLLIGHVQKRLLRSSIIHVMVEGIVSPNSGDPIFLGPIPFSEKAIDASVRHIVEANADVSPEFAERVAKWKMQNGGVLDLTVSEAVDAVLSAAAPDDDLFDRIVTEMRSTQSEQLIDDLYRQLFSLNQWFFLYEPGDDRAPVTWEFPESLNPSPALLAFTSLERAAHAAASLGIYPDASSVSIMPRTVKDAVEWVSSPECELRWICFNLTRQDFPLDCDEAVRLLQENA